VVRDSVHAILSSVPFLSALRAQLHKSLRGAAAKNVCQIVLLLAVYYQNALRVKHHRSLKANVALFVNKTALMQFV